MKKLKLTLPQMQISAAEKYIGGSAANICVGFFRDGERNAAALSSALNGLLRLNDALRISLDADDGGQIINDYTYTEFENLSFASEGELEEYTEKWRLVPLNVASALTEMKTVLLPDCGGVLIKAHHIIADGWTMALLAEQFETLLDGGTPETYSYADYAEKEEKYLAGGRGAADMEYFRRQLTEHTGRAFLKNTEGSSYVSDCDTYYINMETAAKIREYAEKRETTPFFFFAAVIGCYLYRVCGAPESFFIGTPLLNRVGKADMHTAGMFANNVPLLMELDGGRSFSDNLADAVEESCYNAMRHRCCNYTAVLGVLDGHIENAYDLLFSYHAETLRGGAGTRYRHYHCGMQAETLQIHIEDRLHTGGYAVRYEYRRDRLTGDEVRELHNRLEKIIKSAIEDGAKKLAEIDILSEGDRDSMESLNSTAAELPEGVTVCDFFENTARAFPDRVCLCGGDMELSYRELSAAVHAIDMSLRKRLPKGGGAVALLCERSPELYAAIFAILRSGNAFVPIAPDYPQERISGILADCGAAVVLAQEKYLHLCGKTPAINISGAAERTYTDADAAELPILARPDGAAYILYTSGSTGKPKGAKIAHRSLLNRIIWMQKCYPVDGESVILQKTPYTFDVSIWEMLWWGMYGAGVAFSAPGEHFIPAKIVRDIERCGVTHIHFVPSVFGRFVRYLEENPDETGKLKTLRHIFLSGETATADTVNRLGRLLPSPETELHNLYGPTECAIDVTYYDCRRVETDPIPIGRPIDNTSAYIVDADLRPVPVGVMGELLIGGVNVGEGYVGRPELTREKFIELEGVGRAYRTGDNAYLRGDGQIIFCGRADSQLKLNGQRIETGEIETVIAGCRGVKAAAVMLENRDGTDMLCAYYSGARLSRGELQRHCMESLPRYMLPRLWYHVDEMPLNTSGKLDRKALMNAPKELCTDGGSSAPPLDETEALVRRRFAELLRTDEVDGDTDFLLCGGSSLDVITLMSYPEFSAVSVAKFLAHPTPAGLAALLRGGDAGGTSPLQCLYLAARQERAVLLFPYAGGGAEAFTALTAQIRAHSSVTSVYFAPYPHSAAECAETAECAAALAESAELVIYSHCAGAAPAITVVRELERRGVRCTAYIAGGMMPPKRKMKRGKNPWMNVPDFALAALLKSAGAPPELFGSGDAGRRLAEFRHDVDFYTEVFSESVAEPIKCPVTVILGRHDVFALNYRAAASRWRAYCTAPVRVVLLDCKGHYYQSTQAERTAEEILNTE